MWLGCRKQTRLLFILFFPTLCVTHPETPRQQTSQHPWGLMFVRQSDNILACKLFRTFASFCVWRKLTAHSQRISGQNCSEYHELGHASERPSQTLHHSVPANRDVSWLQQSSSRPIPRPRQKRVAATWMCTPRQALTQKHKRTAQHSDVFRELLLSRGNS